MPTLDELLLRELARQTPPVDTRLIDRLKERRRGRHLRRGIGAAALAVAVVAGSTGGFLFLQRAFRGEVQPSPAVTGPVPAPHQDGLIAYAIPGAVGVGIRLANADGSDPHPLTTPWGPRWRDHSPTWSPDGMTIAFVRSLSNEESIIFTVRSDGSGLRQVTGSDNFALDPAWSPDGSLLAYSDGCSLVIEPLQGQRHHVLVARDDQPSCTASPSWSPDGKRIAFEVSRGDSTLRDLYLVAVSSGEVSPLTSTGDVNESQPAWAPAGDRIAFVRETSANALAEIWIMSLSDGTSSALPGTTFGSLFDPTWAPDGTSVLATDRGHGQIVRLPIGRGEAVALFSGVEPSWQPLPSGSPTTTLPARREGAAQRLSGVPFLVCRPMWISGDFGELGDRAWLFEEEPIPGAGCIGSVGFQRIGVGTATDVVAFSSLIDDGQNVPSRWPYATPDIDGDGVDEIAVAFAIDSHARHVAPYRIVIIGEDVTIAPILRNCGPGCEPVPWGAVIGRSLGGNLKRSLHGLYCGPLEGPSGDRIAGLVEWQASSDEPTLLYATLWRVDNGILTLPKDIDYRVTQVPDDYPPDGTEDLCGSPVYMPEHFPNYGKPR